MKIGIFGNINNYPYLLAVAMRRLGIDVRLIVNRREILHRPEGKVASLKGNYPDWILDLGLLSESYAITSSPLIDQAVHFLGEPDAVILNDVALALHGCFSCPILAFLTGSDLLYHASYSSIEERISSWSPKLVSSNRGQSVIEEMKRFVSAQREGISKAKAVNFMPPEVVPEGDKILESLGIPRKDPRRFFVSMADTIDLESKLPHLRRKMRIFNGARINWHLPLPPGFSSLDHKGTDVLLRGFAKFLGAGGEGELRLVRKGYDIARTETLILELGITSSVTWVHELSLYEFYREIEDSDVVCDQLGQSVPAMVTLDGMALGRPVLANFQLDVMKGYYPEPRPFFHVQSDTEVCDRLVELYHKPRLREEIGIAAANYVSRYRSPEANARECLSRLGMI